MASNNLEIQSLAKQLFEYDAVPVPNPKCTAVPEMVCANFHGGVCRKQVLAIDSVNAFVNNIYDVLKSKGIRSADLPIVCKLGEGLGIICHVSFSQFDHR